MDVVDLNADVGEGFGRWELGDDDAVLATVTSANVACGFHAGDPATMTRIVRTRAASTASRSAPTWPTATSPASAAATSTPTRPS